MSNQTRIVIIGLDGVPYGLLKDLSENGVMPNTDNLVKNGIFKKMESSIPEVSSVAWSSMITGKNPAEHGIFGFTDLFPGTYRLSFPNFSSLKKPPFWERNGFDKSIIINVPSTYPVRPMNGVHISGFVSLDLEKSVHPPSLIPKLRKFDYRLDVDSSKAHKSFDQFLADLDETLKSRIETYRYLWNSETWNTFLLVFTGTDRLMHFLWEAYEDRNHKYHSHFLDHFRKIDAAIGEIVSKLNNDDSLMMLSDHGFESLKKDVYINLLLKKEGFLKLKPSGEIDFSDIDFGTKAFSLDPARVYVNTKNNYPCGSVELSDKEKVISDLEDIFKSLELDGKKVIRRICRKEEIFSGEYIKEAPDLTLIGNTGFNLKSGLHSKEVYGKGIFTGKHSQHDSFLFLKDADEGMVPNNPTIFDLVGIIDRSQHKEKQ